MKREIEEDEMGEFTSIMIKNGVNTLKHTWRELQEIANCMIEYAEKQNNLKTKNELRSKSTLRQN